MGIHLYGAPLELLASNETVPEWRNAWPHIPTLSIFVGRA